MRGIAFASAVRSVFLTFSEQVSPSYAGRIIPRSLPASFHPCRDNAQEQAHPCGILEVGKLVKGSRARARAKHFFADQLKTKRLLSDIDLDQFLTGSSVRAQLLRARRQPRGNFKVPRTTFERTRARARSNDFSFCEQQQIAVTRREPSRT